MDIAKSYMLSVNFKLSSRYGIEDLAEPWDRLLAIGEAIASHHEQHFDEALLARTLDEFQAMAQQSRFQDFKEWFFWIFPALLVVLVVTVLRFLYG